MAHKWIVGPVIPKAIHEAGADDRGTNAAAATSCITGDAIFSILSATVAHKDHPQRALYAALRMQEDLKRYSDRLRSEDKLLLQVRVGVNSGEAVARSIETDE